MKGRIYEIIWEYNNYREGGNPSGHSVIQRLNFWQAGWNIFKDHLWTGVGTGDLENSYQREYNKLNSPLEEKYRLHAHNQYLAVAAALGIFGLAYFLLSLVYPMIKRKKVFNFLYITFWITAILSMVAEDTLETQAGVTFFAFFNCFYLFAYDPEKVDQ
jgi:O-antigen ligase